MKIPHIFIIIGIVIIGGLGMFFVNIWQPHNIAIQNQPAETVYLPDDFDELKIRTICHISEESDVLTTMIGDNGTKIMCPINCEVVKNTCVYPLSGDEIIQELQKGPQGLSYAESKFVMNVVKSNPKVQEIIGNRSYTEFCCTYGHAIEKNPHYFLSATLHIQDEDENVVVTIDTKNANVTRVDIFPSWSGAPGKEVTIKPELCQYEPQVFNSIIFENGSAKRQVFFVKTDSTAHLCIEYTSITNTEGMFSFPTQLYTNYYSVNVAPTTLVSLTREPEYMPLGHGSIVTVTYTIIAGNKAGTYWLQDPYNDAYSIVVYSDMPNVDPSEIPILIRNSGPPTVVSTKIVGYDGGIMEYRDAKLLE